MATSYTVHRSANNREVHLRVSTREDGDVLVRTHIALRCRKEVDELIAMLAAQRDQVWPKEEARNA